MNTIKMIATLIIFTVWFSQPEIANAASPPVIENEHLTNEKHAVGEKHDDKHDEGEAHEDAHKDSDAEKEGEGHVEEHTEGETHNEDKDGDHDEAGPEVQLSTAQIREAGIVVEPIRLRKIPIQISVPGEIRLNQYRTQIITPRITAMILKRHAKLGDIVRPGQRLVTIFSVEMAQAQGDFVVAASEWQRVKRLGEEIVSEKRSTEARVAYQQAKGRLLAYGLTNAQIDNLLKSGNRSNPGQFNMLAEQGGLIISDDFLVGEMIEPGKAIYQITDPTLRWVEAKINPDDANLIAPGDTVTVNTTKKTHRGSVIQLEQNIDELTRTLGVRIELFDPQTSLRPGQFVDVTFAGTASESVIAVPKGSVLRNSEGEWNVYQAVSPGTFKPVEVGVVREAEDLVVIKSIPVGTQVVTQGAFFIQSELAKSGFDIHNH